MLVLSYFFACVMDLWYYKNDYVSENKNVITFFHSKVWYQQFSLPQGNEAANDPFFYFELKWLGGT